MIHAKGVAAALSVGVAATTLFTAGPALADSAPAPAPAPAAMFCPPDLQNGQIIRESDGSVLFCVEALGAGAVVARTGVFLEQLIIAPGWTAENDSSLGGGGRHGGSSSGKVDIKFSQPTTGDRVEVRIEPGKTEVRAG